MPVIYWINITNNWPYFGENNVCVCVCVYVCVFYNTELFNPTSLHHIKAEYEIGQFLPRIVYYINTKKELFIQNTMELVYSVSDEHITW